MSLYCGVPTTIMRPMNHAQSKRDGRAVPEIMAHRGASYDAPENTLASFALAWQQGAEGIEGDFHLTKDGVIVCMHDANTQRTAGQPVVIAESTLDELRQLDIGAWKGPQWAGERMLTIDEVFATVPAGKKVFFEVKCGPEMLPVLKKVLAASPLRPAQIAIIAFSADVIAEAKRQLPQLKAFWLTGFRTDQATGTVTPSAKAVVEVLERIGADGVDCNAHPCVDQAFVQTLRAAGKEVHVWTVDDVATARRLVALGVDSLTSNRACWLRQQLMQT